MQRSNSKDRGREDEKVNKSQIEYLKKSFNSFQQKHIIYFEEKRMREGEIHESIGA